MCNTTEDPVATTTPSTEDPDTCHQRTSPTVDQSSPHEPGPANNETDLPPADASDSAVQREDHEAPQEQWKRDMAAHRERTKCNRDDARQVLELLHEGRPFEIRAIHPESSALRPPRSIYLSSIDEALDAVDRESSGGYGIYVTFNEIAPDVAERKARGQATSDTDVIRRRWFMVDVDPERPSGTCATDDEKQHAFDMGYAIAERLALHGWPFPVTFDSGNGCHLLYRIDLPNDSDSRDLIGRCLLALDQRFSDSHTHVDTSVHNAARVIRLPGTLNTKGQDTPERPHRRAACMVIPEERQIVERAQLGALAAEYEPADATETIDGHVEQPRSANSMHQEDTSARTVEATMAELTRLGLEVSKHKDEGDVYTWELEDCPCCPPDTEDKRKAYLCLKVNGTYAAGCHRATCSMKTFAEFQAATGFRIPKSTLPPPPPSAPPLSLGTTTPMKEKPKMSSIAAEKAIDVVLRDTEHDRMSTLGYYKDTPFIWHDGVWESMTQNGLDAHLTAKLKPHYRHVGNASPNGWRRDLQSRALIDSRAMPPCWLAQPTDPAAGGWNPADCLCTPTQIVHLPSVAAGMPTRSTPATPRLFNTVRIGTEYDPNAPEPEAWLEFLASLWLDDPDSIALLQEWFGYCLTSDTSQHKLLTIIGPPRSGKGTISRAHASIIGDDQFTGTTLASLSGEFGAGTLLNKSVCEISETRQDNADSRRAMQTIMSIVGEDTIPINRKHQALLSMRLPVKFVMVGNELPSLLDEHGAVRSRMLCLQTTKSFVDMEDRRLDQKLRAERAGILNWAIEGWRRLQEKGWTIGEASQLLADKAGKSFAPVRTFVEECCVLDPNAVTSNDDLHEAFQTHSDSDMAKSVFGRELSRCCPNIKPAKLPANTEGKRLPGKRGIRLIEDEGMPASDGRGGADSSQPDQDVAELAKV